MVKVPVIIDDAVFETVHKELASQTLTDDDISSIQGVAAAIGEAIDIAIGDKETQREVLSLVDLQATFLVEDGNKSIDVSCIRGRDLSSASQVSRRQYKRFASSV